MTSLPMDSKRPWLLALLLFTAGCLPCTATETTRFVAPDLEQAVDLLPVPPADDSLAGRADLEVVLQIQADRTPAQVERAQRVADHTAFDMGAQVLGPWFTPRNLPRIAAVFAQVKKQCHPVMVRAKERWQRARPYDRDARVKPCVPLPAHTSYPSGHSATAALWAAVYSAAFPEHEAEFAAATRETMWCRVLAGVHYPTDTQAGLLLGAELGRRVLASPEMHQAIAEIRAEVAAFRARSTSVRAN